MKKVINFLMVILLLSSCSREKDPIRFAENEEHGLRKIVTVGDVVYTIQYKPASYIVEMERPDPKAKEERMKQLQGTVCFNISFAIKNFNESPLRYKINGLEDYNARLDYYLNKAGKDMYMLYGQDTLYVNSYWFENNQNLASHETMIVGFKLPANILKPEEDLRLSFYDRVFQNGIIKANIKKSDLENIPE